MNPLRGFVQQSRYKGFARLSALLRADGESTVNAYIDRADLAVAHDMDQEAAARRLRLKDVPLLPVVNAKSVMIGVLTFDDAMDILEQETTDDIMFKAGVGDVFNSDDHIRSEKLTQGPIWYTVRVRILFLMVTLVGGWIVGGLIDQFEDVLGAGIIFREGFNMRGLNTAATLWCCAAAIGMLAGAGEFVLAVTVTGAVVFVNLGLGPLARILDKQPIQTTELTRYHAAEIICKGAQEANVRALMLQGFAENGLHLTGLESENIEDTDRVEVTAEVNADATSDTALEQVVGRLSLEPAVTAARWTIRETGFA